MNTFGKKLRLTTFGESHGKLIGGVIDGFPSDIIIDFEHIQKELDRRKPGQSNITTQRKENDKVDFFSGIFNGKTTGTPIMFYILNNNAKSDDYEHLKNNFRPSHADLTYFLKYTNRDYRGGGRASARTTASIVAAGAFAKQFLKFQNIEVIAWVSQVGSIKMPLNLTFTKNDIENSIVRCPDSNTATQMENLIRDIRKNGDSIGGIISCKIRNCPSKLGNPLFDKFHAVLGKEILNINACKGFDIGSGFENITRTGSENNDSIFFENNQFKTKTNNAGGVLGGITTGADIEFRAVFKPVATIMKPQSSVSENGEKVTILGKGRHDPCVLPRAVPIVEAITALVVADFVLGR